MNIGVVVLACAKIGTKVNALVRSEIRSALAKKNMTQKDLAKILGISTKSMSSKLLGHKPFKLDEAKKIVDELGVEPSIFFTR